MLGPSINIYIHVSQLASASFLGSKVHINIAIFLYSYCSKNVLVFALSLHFLKYPPPLCITETFHESWLWGSAKWFYSKYRFWWGEMYLSNIHRHLNPSRYFLEIFKKWTSLFNMGFKYLDLDNQLFKYRWILSKKYVYYIPRRGIWMGYRSWHFSASEILSMIFFKKINNDARVWSSRKNTFSITAFNILYTHFF